ncbi:MAG: ATP phosphoribosyltransferase regulatory subunit, partial [Nanoarchaeota archaeon]
YEMGIVFRDGPIKAGRVRQFWQCDADVVGSSSLLAEAELLNLFERVFVQLGLPVIIKVNNRKVLNGILAQAGVQDKEKAIVAIDKLDKIGKEGVSKELEQRGCSTKQVKDILSLIKEGITLTELKQKLTNEEGKQGIAELEELFGYLKLFGVTSAVFDVSLARGLAYYTGAVFEVFMKKGTITSSLGSGGRWDNMIGSFMGGGRVVPAVGVSFGLVPIAEALKEKKTGERKTPSMVLVLPINTVKESLIVAQELREAGICTDFALGKGVSKNLEYASALKIPYVIMLGENELKKKKVLLRDMSTGTEQLLTVKNVVKKLAHEQ